MQRRTGVRTSLLAFAVVLLAVGVPRPAGAGTAGWTHTGNMAAARYGATATRLLDGRVLVAGAYRTQSPLWVATAEIYDPALGGGTPREAWPTRASSTRRRWDPRRRRERLRIRGRVHEPGAVGRARPPADRPADAPVPGPAGRSVRLEAAAEGVRDGSGSVRGRWGRPGGSFAARLRGERGEGPVGRFCGGAAGDFKGCANRWTDAAN